MQLFRLANLWRCAISKGVIEGESRWKIIETKFRARNIYFNVYKSISPLLKRECTLIFPQIFPQSKKTLSLLSGKLFIGTVLFLFFYFSFFFFPLTAQPVCIYLVVKAGKNNVVKRVQWELKKCNFV